MQQQRDETCIVTKIRVKDGAASAFADWQAEFNATIAKAPGFLSLEILSPYEPKQPWIIVQRFQKEKDLSNWLDSNDRRRLIDDLQPILDDTENAFLDKESGATTHRVVTEVFVTQVLPDKDSEYRQWIAKIHQVEAKFPGFKGVYVQSPKRNEGHHWITMLQFDTQENLDRWLASSERHQVLLESKNLIDSIESHRVISPFAGWFSSVSKGEIPPAWKQTMIVLLVLFPIVMLELKFLSPLTNPLNRSLGTFIGNAISAILISWPAVPIAIYFLNWWLSPPKPKSYLISIAGTVIVLILYLFEIVLFWNFL